MQLKPALTCVFQNVDDGVFPLKKDDERLCGGGISHTHMTTAPLLRNERVLPRMMMMMIIFVMIMIIIMIRMWTCSLPDERGGSMTDYRPRAKGLKQIC